jgi:hypothetical protein
MQYFLDNLEISYQEFVKLFPVEGSFLDNINIENAQLHAVGEKLTLNFAEFKGFHFPLLKRIDYHKKYFFKNSIYKDPLAKALGIKKGKDRPSIIDATGGALNDSMLILSYGVKSLDIFERNPLIACLGYNAIQSLKNYPATFHFGDASKYNFNNKVDVVYFDPMYESKRSKTAPKKEMAIFRLVVQDDFDKREVALKLFEKARERVVIKRSLKNSPLIEEPDITIKGKSTAYDIYLV